MGKKIDMELLKKERLIVFQAMADAYLVNNKIPPTKILFKEMKDEYGELTDEQAAILKKYLEDEYKKMGLDINDAIRKAGEEPNKNDLTKFETNELIRRADEMIVFLGIFKMRKDALKK